MNSKSIKETSELVNGLSKLVLLILKKKSGSSVSSFELLGMLLTDPDFRLALDGVGQVKEELKDLSLDETIQLSTLILKALPQWIAAAKA